MPEDFAVIANITDQQSILHRTYGNFVVAARPPGAAYALTRVTSRRGVIDLGDKRTLEHIITAREIAEDLAREINSDAGPDSFLGAFVCAADLPTDAELAAARERLHEFYSRLVDAADREWERSHAHLFITDLERRAAGALGLEKEWAYRADARIECPACGEMLKRGVAVCRACGAVLDPVKAAQFGLAAPAPAVLPEPKPREGKRP